ncbi:MAG: hypothetical protein Q9160_003401 [Pyrenula sp. 1 TL-2023]
MAADFKSFLATAIISDQRTCENAKKAGSVHATYLVSGVRKPTEALSSASTQNETNGDMDVDGDVPPSSPPMSSSMPAASQEQNGYTEEVPVFSITLVREEDLEGKQGEQRVPCTYLTGKQGVKQFYQSISSIHIYSLEPAPLQDLNVLTSCSQELFDQHFVKEDPMEYNGKYGVIQNKSVKRRTNRRPPPPPAPTATLAAASKAPPKSATTPSQQSKSQPNSKPELKRTESQESQSRASSKGKPDTKPLPSTKSSTLKRDTSDLFKSFAKGSQKPKAEARPSPSASSAASPSNSREDTPMKDAPSSDDEGSEDPNLFAANNINNKSKTKRPSDTARQDREAKLRKMMDDAEAEEPDSPMPDANASTQSTKPSTAKPKPPNSRSRTPSNASSASAAEWSASDREDNTSQQKEIPQAAPKRRRTRRQIMKKKTTKDADGYLVTTEEPVWESFSEDEPAPSQKLKQKPKPTVAGGLKREDSGGVKKEKEKEKEKEKGGKGVGGGAGKKGKGDIMSFFAKK